ncbi:stage III sporulation protein AF [Cohnella silvisoli]|uniref:Stage III sporulation protein AF n=1 Tax=Cohnella silvisoli TaxID=2873699 RepID=A0ABV1KSQ9_9BACL|nr:stage III sporulation protein AF [Cohnella silvisoli]MCD9021329.1 stage III sporulation protein AF [Cohnella silvisoli]
MGLMEGLSHWLRQIIAVILLASLIDMLLPNRTMQRYVRLVAGLFILMTVATPIMHWMKGDFTTKLAEGLDAVERTPQEGAEQLAMIEKEGAKLRDKQNIQAADLVSARLESAIRSEVEQSEKRGVRKVDVVLERGNDGSLAVAKVIVLLEPEQVGGESSRVRSAAKEVDPIADVDIQIKVDSWPSDDHEVSATPKVEGNSVNEKELNPEREARLRISALIASRFGFAASIVEVKTPVAADTANSN